MTEYDHNLKTFKDLIDQYTIADLKSMIYDIQVKDSGACCYPAIQTLISLMEMLGKLLKNKEGEEAIRVILEEMGPKYQISKLENILYLLFRHGIAHNSLAKGGVAVKKDGDTTFHLSSNGHNIDVKIFFEDFKFVYDQLFKTKLLDQKYLSFYEDNLKSILKELKTKWLDFNINSFVVNPNFSTTTTSSGIYPSGVSGMRGPKNSHTP